jgi:hypothetical protein
LNSERVVSDCNLSHHLQARKQDIRDVTQGLYRDERG